METLLGEMKWPFPSGISAPLLSDSNKDVMKQFDSLVNLFLKLDTEYPFICVCILSVLPSLNVLLSGLVPCGGLILCYCFLFDS